MNIHLRSGNEKCYTSGTLNYTGIRYGHLLKLGRSLLWVIVNTFLKRSREFTPYAFPHSHKFLEFYRACGPPNPRKPSI